MLAPSRGALLALAALLTVSVSSGSHAAAQPAHCSRAAGATAWPARGTAIDTTDPSPVTAADAASAVRAFRAAWRGVPHASEVLRSFTECMDASDEHYVVRRVSVNHARRGVEQLAGGPFASLVLWGTASALPPTGWVWEVYWGGGSRRHPPSGPVSAYFSADFATLYAAVQWPEG